MKIEYDIPSKLSEIKLRDYQKFIKTTIDSDSLDFQNLKMIEIFCKIKLKEADNLPMLEVDYAAEVINKMFIKPPKFNKEFNILELNGVKYGFIPNIEKISSGEYAYLVGAISDVNEWHTLMSVMYRPIVQEKDDLYLIEKYDSDKVKPFEMLDAPMDYVLATTFFFQTLSKELLSLTLSYLQKELEKLAKMNNSSTKNGVGSETFTLLQEEIFLTSQTLQNLDFSSALTSWPTRKVETQLNEIE